MSGVATSLYKTVLGRTSSTAIVVIVGALFYERGVSIISGQVFDSVNKGKQWKDIKHLYEK